MAGLVGAILVFVLFDWSLIINSAISGAFVIAAGVNNLVDSLTTGSYLLVVVALLVVGIVYQAREYRSGKAVTGVGKPSNDDKVV